MTTIQQLIERQIQRWNLEQERRLALLATTPSQGPLRPHWITISRERGAGGGEVASLLAERLGYHVFDKEILEAMARESDFRRATLETLDEKERSWVTVYLEGLLQGRALDRSDYVRHLMQVVLGIGQHGCAVILGRGASFVLTGEGVHVRLIAPVERRISRVAARTGLGPDEAGRLVLETDRERARFVRRYFDRDVAEPSQYDLVLNTAALGVEPSARLIEMALGEKLAARGPVSETRGGTEEHGA
jgi:cytidylate kinase